LFLHGRQVSTVFELLGHKENDITFSLGWVLSQSPALRQRALRGLFPGADHGEFVSVRLQEWGKQPGYTDIEIETQRTHAIIEAKCGWVLPTKDQLAKYASRLAREPRDCALLVISECSGEYARSRLPRTARRVRVEYRSWRRVWEWAREAGRRGSHAEKRLLREFGSYLKGAVSVQNQESNMVYVVVLSPEVPEWSRVSYIEFVTKCKRYFHPYGGTGGWPRNPPNYLGFRWDGQLQRIHHVEGYEIVTDLSAHIKQIIATRYHAVSRKHRWMDDPMVLYRLGPPIVPGHTVKTGQVYANGRVWAALDLLLTCKTVSEAREKTRKRLAASQDE
jgi:hypothetical protein